MLRNLHVKNLALIDEMERISGVKIPQAIEEIRRVKHFNRRNRRRKIIDHRFN